MYEPGSKDTSVLVPVPHLTRPVQNSYPLLAHDKIKQKFQCKNLETFTAI